MSTQRSHGNSDDAPNRHSIQLPDLLVPPIRLVLFETRDIQGPERQPRQRDGIHHRHQVDMPAQRVTRSARCFHASRETANAPVIPAAPALELRIRDGREDGAEHRRDDDMQEGVEHDGVDEEGEVVGEVHEPVLGRERDAERAEVGVRLLEEARHRVGVLVGGVCDAGDDEDDEEEEEQPLRLGAGRGVPAQSQTGAATRTASVSVAGSHARWLRSAALPATRICLRATGLSVCTPAARRGAQRAKDATQHRITGKRYEYTETRDTAHAD